MRLIISFLFNVSFIILGMMVAFKYHSGELNFNETVVVMLYMILVQRMVGDDK
ncbi:hypothetical protein [Listeria sp. SHR_NRA_18]|uniref:hypothetical protein n=1 Tax=Listeria sp. SHR_NRA_18 TaxID=2269046 RepID=UPI001374FD82|nr:hypothetical protein [Listeria sp. SHR_NRA_18]